MKYWFFCLGLFFLLPNVCLADGQDIDDAYVQKILDSGNAAKLQQLIDSGLDVNSRDADGDTMLFYLLTHVADLDTAQILINAGADVNLPSSSGLTPILVATAAAAELQNNFRAVDNPNSDVDLEIAKANLTQQKNFLIQRSVNLLKLLIDNGADINQETPRGTPLMNASTSDLNLPLVEILLKSGAKVNQQDRYGRTALFYAAAFGSENISTALLKAGADIQILDNDGRSYMEVGKKDITDNY